MRPPTSGVNHLPNDSASDGFILPKISSHPKGFPKNADAPPDMPINQLDDHADGVTTSFRKVGSIVQIISCSMLRGKFVSVSLDTSPAKDCNCTDNPNAANINVLLIMLLLLLIVCKRNKKAMTTLTKNVLYATAYRHSFNLNPKDKVHLHYPNQNEKSPICTIGYLLRPRPTDGFIILLAIAKQRRAH